MSQTSLVYLNDKHLKTQPRPLVFRLQITAAKTVSKVPVGADCLVAFDAITQETIDNYLGTTLEFLATQFDATSLGANDLGIIVQMDGQCGKLTGAKLDFYDATGALIITLNSAAVTVLSSSTPLNECARGDQGNMAVKFKDITGLDAATSGQLVVTLYWIAQ